MFQYIKYLLGAIGAVIIFILLAYGYVSVLQSDPRSPYTSHEEKENERRHNNNFDPWQDHKLLQNEQYTPQKTMEASMSSS